MISNLFLSFFLSTFSHAAVTGVTQGCPEKARVFANEGEKFVTVNIHGKNEKLTSSNGEPFSFQAKEPVTFRTDDKNLEFQMTSMVMNSLPRLIINYSDVQKTCRVDLNGTNDKK